MNRKNYSTFLLGDKFYEYRCLGKLSCLLSDLREEKYFFLDGIFFIIFGKDTAIWKINNLLLASNFYYLLRSFLNINIKIILFAEDNCEQCRSSFIQKLVYFN